MTKRPLLIIKQRSFDKKHRNFENFVKIDIVFLGNI